MLRDNARFHYFRDHQTSGMWGVRESSGRVVAVGMEKTDALAVALFLSGQDDDARTVRESLLRQTSHVPGFTCGATDV